MPSSKSSVDNRDVYYRLGKSAGYRARSAYKLLHLDEEFDLFSGVTTAVDLCAAPGSWSQVLGQALKPGKGKDDAKVVSVDLQPMAPLPNITILQTDITLPSTVPLVLEALGGRKADLVVCDGAPDVTGVHDLDAYLHSQLLLAALTLSLTLLAPGATLIFKIFLSPLDPQAAMLRSQLQCFFPGDAAYDVYREYEDDEIERDYAAPSMSAAKSSRREGGVWVRKPRSSRKGSGEAFIVCRNFDPSTVPLPVVFPPEALLDLARQITGTLTLDSLAHLTSHQAASKHWEATKAYVGSGDLDFTFDGPARAARPDMSIPIYTDGVSRNSSVKSIRALHPQPTPCDEPDEYFASDSKGQFLVPNRPAEGDRRRKVSLTVDAAASRRASADSLPTPGSASSSSHVSQDRLFDRNPSPLPTPRKHGSPEGLSSSSTREWTLADTPRDDGAVSPALSTCSKTDQFFASSQSEILPTPPRPVSRAPSIGRGLPSSLKGHHDRTASMPTFKARTDSAVLKPAPFADGMPRAGPSSFIFGTPRIVSQEIPASPLSTLPTFPEVAAPLPGSRPMHARRESQQLSRETREAPLDVAHLQAGDVLIPNKEDRKWPVDSHTRWKLIKHLGQGAFSEVWSAQELEPNEQSVAAVKLTSRATCSSNSRTRIAFLREVSVLRHLSHPNIVSFIASFSTSTHHCLVLEKLPGGELFELLSDDENRHRMLCPGPAETSGEGVVRRIFSELVRGVAWLHEVGVVHRDIKLENILLTCNLFKLPPTPSGSIPLDQLPSPLVKLTDFGLSRFINPASPTLQTRCGSESFAAPEIIMGKTYDGRETDAWAMGVVLFALIAGELPFDSQDEGRGEREERKRRMMKIAKGQYAWPEGVGSAGVRSIVGRLLVRSPRDRAKLASLWREEWMKGPGSIDPPLEELDAGSSWKNGPVLAGRRKVLDGFLLDEEVEEEAQAEAV